MACRRVSSTTGPGPPNERSLGMVATGRNRVNGAWPEGPVVGGRSPPDNRGVEYQLVFEVGERIPEIAFGVAGLFALVVFIVIGLFAFDELPRRWPLVLGVALV